MVNFKYILDSDSDEEIGWSRTKDLPRSRQSQLLDRRLAEAKRTGTFPTSSNGLASKRIKIEPKEEEEDEATRRLNIANWPKKLLARLMHYVPVEGRAKMRSTCNTLKEVVDAHPKWYTQEIDIRRLDEAEIGLFIAQDKKEGRFVIANKNFKWVEQPLRRTLREMRRGMVAWTRHHRNRMGRIKTAIRTLFKLNHIFKLNISQVNLSNSFLRDIWRILHTNPIHALKMEVQMWESERPDLTYLNNLNCKSISLGVRLKEREPLPQVERFLKAAKNKYEQIILEVRQDSWKFHSSLHFRKSYEDYGMTNNALFTLMTGKKLDFIRFKFVCRYVNKDGIMATIKHLRTTDANRPSRGFCVVVHENTAKQILPAILTLPEFGTRLDSIMKDEHKARFENYATHHTTDEFLELRPIRQEKGRQPLIEVRYWRKGNDEKVRYFSKRIDDSGKFDPFEQPRWKKRPV